MNPMLTTSSLLVGLMLVALPGTPAQAETEPLTAQTAPNGDLGSIHGLVRTGVVSGDYVDLPEQDAEFGPEFGYSVAMQGEWLVVGAPGTIWTHPNISTDDHGAVFVFRRGSGGWQLQQRLLVQIQTASGPGGMRCGHAVALRLPHLAIGCPEREAPDGAVGGYIRMLKLDPEDQLFVNDRNLSSDNPSRCGAALALTRNFLAYGCPLAGTDEDGRVGVYRRDPVTDRFTEFDGNRLPPDDTPGISFGHALAMFEPALLTIGPPDLRLAIGAPNDVYSGSIWPRGSVHLFNRNPDTGAWSRETVLRLSDVGEGGNDFGAFGSALAMNSNQLVASAPNNRFGSINTLPGPGSVHRFEYFNVLGGSYQWQTRESGGAVNLADGPHAGMRWGESVAIGHSNLIAISAPATDGSTQFGGLAEDVGLVELRRTANGDWSVFNYHGELRPGPIPLLARAGGRFGHGLATDTANRRLAAGYPRSGSTLLDRPRGTVWLYETDLIFADGHED